MNIRGKSLNEIYGLEPVEPEIGSYVLRTAARAMQLPLEELSPEEIRLLIGQKVGLQYLLPLAIGILQKNPMKQASLFPGDLLEVCKRLDPNDWNANSLELCAFQDVLKAAEPRLVTGFDTPCGRLLLTDSKGNIIPFQIQQMIWDLDLTVYDYIAQKPVPLESPHQYTITIPAGQLTHGETYTLRLQESCNCKCGDSDECAVASIVTKENVTMSLGAQDFNDAEKNCQAVPLIKDGVQIGLRYPDRFDESKFRGYLLFALQDWSGYQFRLLDDSAAEVRFRLAWAEHTAEGVNSEEYTAVTNWTIM